MILSKQFLNELIQKKVLNEARNFKVRDALPKDESYDVFISYSYLEKDSAISITQLLQKTGYSVYIDLRDDDINKHKSVNKETANRIIKNMKSSKALLYLQTKATKISQWCPWELGYFNGFRNRCAIIQLTEKTDEILEHQEFLSLYPTIEYAKVTGTNNYEFWVFDRDSRKKFSTLKKWILSGIL